MAITCQILSDSHKLYSIFASDNIRILSINHSTIICGEMSDNVWVVWSGDMMDYWLIDELFSILTQLC